jgi:hypothetical protein
MPLDESSSSQVGKFVIDKDQNQFLLGDKPLSRAETVEK